MTRNCPCALIIDDPVARVDSNETISFRCPQRAFGEYLIAIRKGSARWFTAIPIAGHERIYGVVTKVEPYEPAEDMALITIRQLVPPTIQDDLRKMRELATHDLTHFADSFYVAKFVPTHHKEDSVKIFEAIIVRMEDKGVGATVRLEPIEIVKVIGPTLAKSAADFAQAVLFDYGVEKALSGKDLAGFQVRVREFQVTI